MRRPLFSDRNDLYARQLRERSESTPLWVLHDGPPYANGRLHLGHALNKVQKSHDDDDDG